MPQNQEYERSALAALGIEFTLVRSTSEALPLLRRNKFSAVITDFKRGDDAQGGYTLLDEVEKIDSKLPVIIYTGTVTTEYEADAKRRGAFGQTNQPQRLFEMAIEAILNKR